MNTTVPKVTHPTSGLTLTRNRWHIETREDGKRKLRSLGTTDRDEAIAMRDKIYSVLLSNGATVHRAAGRPPSEGGVYHTRLKKPWKVVVGKRYVGTYATREEAVDAKEDYLKNA
jgi:hypothetical protein